MVRSCTKRAISKLSADYKLLHLTSSVCSGAVFAISDRIIFYQPLN
ncbi:MAG: hypothetical protein RIE73_07320 [Coleofasciculus sp. C1-SOL-03]